MYVNYAPYVGEKNNGNILDAGKKKGKKSDGYAPDVGEKSAG
jgi:hypothetical protein